jgi:hypothetical protein
MQIIIEMGPDFPQTVAELGAMGSAVLAAANEGLSEGAQYAATNVVENFLTGQYLKTRSGQLRTAVQGWLAGPLDAIVGVRPNSKVEKYKWLLGEESIGPIMAKPGHALTIPIGEALTPADVAKFSSVKDAESKLGVDIFRPIGKNVLGYVRGKKGKFRPLFVLVKSVFVQPTGALIDGVLDSEYKIVGLIESKISDAIGV